MRGAAAWMRAHATRFTGRTHLPRKETTSIKTVITLALDSAFVRSGSFPRVTLDVEILPRL